MKQGIVLTVVFWFGVLMTYAVIQDVLEAEKQTPAEWTFFSRSKLRSAYGNQTMDANGMGFIDFAKVGHLYRKLLARLEDPQIDGAGLVEQEEGGIDIPGAGKAGYDISSKSYAWKAGYYECLMGCAKAAEHLDGQVVDKKTLKVMPAHYVPGPSNPNPKPTPPWRPAPPSEEQTEPASPPPEQFYVQILTTKGFTSKQRMDAAIAYGEWLDFKQLHEAAEEVHKWAMDIATENLQDPSSVIIPSSSVLRSGSDVVTPNILTAATAMATHYAVMSRVSDALPVYLSVLRARRSAPEGNPLPNSEGDNVYDLPSATDIEAMTRGLRWFFSIFKEKRFPVVSSGDEPFVRRSEEVEACEDAKIMTYIGEILFASSASEKAQNDAVSWTRNAVDIADRGVQNMRLEKPSRLRCLDCKDVALDNWVTMARSMSEAERQRRLSGSPQQRGWKSWVGSGSSVPSGPESAIEDQGDGRRGPWRCQEEKDAELKLQQYLRQGMREKLTYSPFEQVWPRVGWLLQW